MVTKNGLDAELALLTERLGEAEDMCRAIANGEVDGFVVGTDEAHKHVLLLSHAYLRYRRFVERMQHGAVTVSSTGEILYASNRFAQLLGEPLSRLLGVRLHAFIDRQDVAALNRLLASASEQAELGVRLQPSNGEILEAHLLVVSFSDGYASILITDLEPGRRVELAEDTIDAIRRGAVDAVVLNEERVVMLDDAARYANIDTIAGELRVHLTSLRASAAGLTGTAVLDAESRHAVQDITRQAEALERSIKRWQDLRP